MHNSTRALYTCTQLSHSLGRPEPQVSLLGMLLGPDLHTQGQMGVVGQRGPGVSWE